MILAPARPMARRGMTAESLQAHTAARGGDPEPIVDDDVASVVSTMSRSSLMTVNPSPHALGRADERNISVKDIQRAKAYGQLSLAFILRGEQVLEQVKDDIRAWGKKLQQNFDLMLGDPQLCGGAEKRVELRLIDSQNKGPEIKAFLVAEGYFSADSRMQRVLFVERRMGKELVVVEGMGQHAAVQIITVFRRERGVEQAPPNAEQTIENYISEACIDLYNRTVTPIIQRGDFPDQLEHAFLQFEFTSQHADGRWCIGPYLLSSWPQSKPFLHLAATYGRDASVELLLGKFGVDVNFQNKKNNTPLHLAAYWAQQSTVALLLRFGADPSIRNSLDETPAKVARVAMKAWEAEPWRVPGKRLDVYGECFTKERPPTWDGIIALLEESAAA